MSDTHEWITTNAETLSRHTAHGLGWWLDELSFIADLPERDDIVDLAVAEDMRPSVIIGARAD